MSKPSLYNLTLDMGGAIYESKGETLLEALQAIPLEWNQIKAKCIVKITKGELFYEHLFFIKQIRRILINKITKQIWAKRLELLLESDKTNSFGALKA